MYIRNNAKQQNQVRICEKNLYNLQIKPHDMLSYHYVKLYPSPQEITVFCVSLWQVLNNVKHYKKLQIHHAR